MSVTRTSNNPAIPIDISAAGLQRERRRAGRQWLVAGLVAGDLVCVLLAMSTGFYLKFFSPLGALGMLSPAPANWLTYLPQFSLAAVLFLGLQLYNDRFSRAGLLASPLLGLRTACVWGALLALVSLGLKVDPAISRLFVLFSTCTARGVTAVVALCLYAALHRAQLSQLGAAADLTHRLECASAGAAAAGARSRAALSTAGGRGGRRAGRSTAA